VPEITLRNSNHIPDGTKDDAKLIESARGVRQVLFEAFNDDQLGVAYRLGQDQQSTATWWTVLCRRPSHDVSASCLAFSIVETN
jgi:hypothetical protein